MTRENVQEFLKGQLIKLQDVHVDDLMKASRHEELEEILEDVELDFSPIKEFWDQEGEAIYQLKGEIPKEFCYELALYMQQSGLQDVVFFSNYWNYQDLLMELEEKVAENIADVMDKGHICEFTVKELVAA